MLAHAVCCVQTLQHLALIFDTNASAVQLRKVDRKLKLCHNPLTDASSAAFKAAAAAQQQRLALARRQKACMLLTFST